MYIGIDLGTTYSAVSMIDDEGKPVLVQNKEGEYTTPSAVLFGEESVLVGSMAIEGSSCDPLNFVQFIKRNMGDENFFHLTTFNKEYNAEELSSIILKKLVEDTEYILNEKVEGAVITVPAYFDDVRRKATLLAANLAGLNCIKIINEPTAAALAFFNEKNIESGRLLVFDLGGGTFDVTVVEKKADEINVIGTDGDRNLGGFDFDNLILNDVVAKYDIDIFDDYESGIELRHKVTALKKQLSFKEKAGIKFKFNGKTYDYSIKREEFSKMLEPYISTMELIMEKVIDEANLTWKDIDHLVMVGGSSRIPAILESMERISGKRPDVSLNQDHAVAQGAAIQASILSKSGSSLIKVNDVNSHSLGIIAVDTNNERINSILIPRNTPIPKMCSRLFKTVAFEQEKILIELTEGETSELKYCNVIGKAEIALPKGLDTGTKIKLDMAIDTNQIVHVYAFIHDTNQKLGEIHVERKIDMDEEEFKAKSTAIRAINIG